jgi:RNA polymerase sigma factor (TIGR02999 family)
MRRILVDHARARRTAKRGGGALFLTAQVAGQRPIDAEGLLALDRALERLAVIDAQAARLVEQRYFAGATEAETGQALGLSPATIRRRWAFAKAWLQRELTESRA